MHVIAMKRQILDEHPWVAGSLYNAFLESEEPQHRAPDRAKRVALSAALAGRPMRAGCATCSTATRSRSASRRTGRPSSSSCATPTSRASRTVTPRSRRFSRKGMMVSVHTVSMQRGCGSGRIRTRQRRVMRTAADPLAYVRCCQGLRVRTSHLPLLARQASPCIHDELPSRSKLARNSWQVTAVLVAGGRDRRHRAARPGLGILPGHAGVLAALAHDLAHRRPRDDEIALRRQVGDRLEAGPAGCSVPVRLAARPFSRTCCRAGRRSCSRRPTAPAQGEQAAAGSRAP